MPHVIRDTRLALRGFRRTPVFAVTVLAVLGLGIGMAVAIFTVFDAILLRRLPVREQDRIAVLWPHDAAGQESTPLAVDLPALRQGSRTMREIAGVAHWGTTSSAFLDADRTVVLGPATVTSNYFDVLGARPALGRLLRREDGEAGAAPAMVLSYSAWRSQFGGDPGVIGRRLIEAHSRVAYPVVGVAEPGLDYPVGAGAWTAIAGGGSQLGPRVLAVARLSPDATITAARAEFFSVVSRLHPEWKLSGAKAETFSEAVLGDMRPILVAVAAAAGLLLLIACVNVANLFLLRAASRARELAVRRALGASYAALVRQLVVESGLLALAGGALGAACAAAIVRLLLRLAPPQLPRIDDLRLHGDLLVTAVGVTGIATLLFGVLPALVAARGDPATPLRLDARSSTRTRGHRLFRHWLVAVQVGLAVVMLAGAGLLTRSLRRLAELELGFRPEQVLVARLAFDGQKYPSIEQEMALGDEVERRVRALPGVTAATSMWTRPFAGATVNTWAYEAEGQTLTEASANEGVPSEAVGADYFRALGIPLLGGRGFRDSDRAGAPLVVVVSQSVARRFWPGQDPVGQRIRYYVPASLRAGVEWPEGFFDWRTVIGVVDDTHIRTPRESSPMVYLPWRQTSWSAAFGVFLTVRSSRDLGATTAAMRRVLQEIDPALVVWDARTMDQLVSDQRTDVRLSASLVAAFAAVALVLAAVGLYGAMASAVREQTREIGIRAALGAAPGQLCRSVVAVALQVAGWGTLLGLGGAALGSRLVSSLLYEVEPNDPPTLVGVSMALLITTLVAAYVPARRATEIDPVQALRAD